MIKEGDIIKFGKYPQGENGEVKPIEWLVLEVKPDEALLISRYGIECKRYLDPKYTRSNWRDCTLREWLNNDFVGLAFSEEEEKKIKYSITGKHSYIKYVTKDWNTIKDKVFCLDSTEVTWYFKHDDNDRKCKPSEYIIKRKRDKKIYLRGFLSGYSYWWLRSDTESIFATVVNTKGGISDKCLVHEMACIRPALRLILNRGEL